MPVMEIAVFPLEKESRPSIDDFVNSCIRIAGEKGAKCKLTPTGAKIEGDKNALLEILYELDSASFNFDVRKKVVVTLRVNENNGNILTRAEI